MARRKKSRRRQKFTGINITNVAEGYSYAALLTQMAFEVDPVTFLLGDSTQATSLGHAHGGRQVSLKEIITRFNMGHHGTGSGTSYGGGSAAGGLMTEAELVKANIMNNWIDSTIKGVVLGASWRIGRKLTATPRRKANKLFKDIGLGQVLRV